MIRLYYYSATWCAPCRKFGPLLAEEAAARGIELDKRDIDTEAGESAAATFDVRSVPTVVAVEAGLIVDRFGYMPASVLRDRLDALAGGGH